MFTRSMREMINTKQTLFVAAEEGDLSTIKGLLTSPKYFDLINAQARNGHSLLQVAALAGHRNIVEFLIKQGANIFFRSRNQLTASESVQDQDGESKIFQYLRKKELSLLQIAILSDNPEKLSNLIEKGADLDVCDSDGESMAHFAARNGRARALEQMEEGFGRENVYYHQNNNGETPLNVLRYQGRYYKYENGLYSKARNSKGQTKRPGNQSYPAVLRKIAGNMRQLPIDDSDIEFTQKQTEFMDKVELTEGKKVKLSRLKIDVAHNIGIGPIMDSIVDRMNNPLDEEDSTAKKFVDEIVSSDDDAAKEALKDFFDNIQDDNIFPHEKIQQADQVTERINKASSNLTPGHKSTNRSIGEHRDPHVVISKEDGEDVLIEHLKSQRIAVRGRRFLGVTNPTPYRPHIRFNTEGGEEAKSSSVHAQLTHSWFRYTSPSSDILSPEYFADTEVSTPTSERGSRQKSPSHFKGSKFRNLNTLSDLPEEELEVSTNFYDSTYHR